jgi:hypothetical protein
LGRQPGIEALLHSSASSYQPHTRDSGPEASACSKDLADKAVREFAVSILHGDKAHQDWPIEAAERFIAGETPPKPPGSRGGEAVPPGDT